MIKKGSIVQLTTVSRRRTREVHAGTGVVLADPFLDQGVQLCPVGFFHSKYGAWTKIALLSDLREANPEPETSAVLQPSYRPEYRIWISMRRRCSDPRNQGFHSYTNRVHVCAAWSGSFDQFFADMGPRPTPRHSLDRIDNEGGYEPGNVRWATAKEQARNRSDTRFVTANGQTKPLAQWAEELGLSIPAFAYRLRKWGAESAVNRPKDPHQPFLKGQDTKRKRGEGHYRAKLTPEKVRAIRLDKQNGLSVKAIAAKYSVVEGTIICVLNGTTWQHVV